jgi:HSP20 family protein
MGLMRSPFREFALMDREMEDMIRRFFGESPRRVLGERGGGWLPAMDVVERKEEILVRADLPGLTEKDIEVTVQQGVLTLKGERKAEAEEKEDTVYLDERPVGPFVRTLTLPADVDQEKIEARFKNGVLEVRLHKTREARTRKIEIKVE